MLGCQSQTTEEKEPPSKVSKKVEDTYAQITKKLDELTTSGKDLSQSTVEEMEKLFVFEYKVLEVPLDAPTKDVETALQNAGKERWECFTAQTITTSLRFFCKRRPESVLRYVPYVPRFLW